MTLEEASLLGLFLETLFYGVFLTLYSITLFVLLKNGATQRRFLIPVATLLLCIATAHLIIDYVRTSGAFLGSSSAYAYYSNLASPLELAKTALFITQPIIADGVIVWRCYVLYSRSLWVGILGCIALLANGAIGYCVVWFLSQAEEGSTFYTTAPGYITTFYVVNVLISVTCTTLIAWRIYYIRRLQPDGLAYCLPLFIAIVECSALYATSIIALLVAFLTGSDCQYPAMDLATPLVGITFCLIFLQVHFRIGGQRSDSFPAQDVRNTHSSMRPIIDTSSSPVMGRKYRESLWDENC